MGCCVAITRAARTAVGDGVGMKVGVGDFAGELVGMGVNVAVGLDV